MTKEMQIRRILDSMADLLELATREHDKWHETYLKEGKLEDIAELSRWYVQKENEAKEKAVKAIMELGARKES